MSLCNNRFTSWTRRDALQALSCGFGLLAFAGIANQAQARPARRDEDEGNPLSPKSTHLEPRAKRIIFLCMSGGPSHVDTFDYKPRLATDAGKTLGGTRAGAQLLPSHLPEVGAIELSLHRSGVRGPIARATNSDISYGLRGAVKIRLHNAD